MLVPLGNRGLPALVEGEQVSLADLFEVGAWPIEIHCGRRRLAGTAGLGAGEDQQRVSGADDLPGRHQAPDGTQCIRRHQRMLHLHRLEDDELAAGADLYAFGSHLDHRAGQLRAQHFLARVELNRGNTNVMLPRKRRGRQFGQLFVEEARHYPCPIGPRCRTTALAEARCSCECPRC